jgi:fructokinase
MQQIALVLGESLVDVVRGEGGEVRHPGGSAANVAVALARLGRPVRFGTAFADDDDGRIVAEHLAASGVELAGDPGVVPRTSVAEATIGADGAATYHFDLDWRLGEVKLPDGVEPAVVHVGSIGAVLRPGADDVLAAVHRWHGTATVSLDVNARPGITGTGPEVVGRIEELASLADVVKASDEDLEVLWPRRELDDAARALLGKGPSVVAVTRGAAGARWWTRETHGTADPVRVDVADTIGAGDTFSAGLIDALWERDLLGAGNRAALRVSGAELWDAVVGFAARAAAITVSRPGADPPWEREIRR